MQMNFFQKGICYGKGRWPETSSKSCPETGGRAGRGMECSGDEELQEVEGGRSRGLGRAWPTAVPTV